MSTNKQGSRARAFETRKLKEAVDKYLTKHPESNIYTLYFEFPHANKRTLSTYKYLFHKESKFSKKELKILLMYLEKIIFIFKYKVKLLHKLNVEEKQALSYIEKLIVDNGGTIP